MPRNLGTAGNQCVCYCYLSSSIDTNQSRMIFLNPWIRLTKLSKKGPVAPHLQLVAEIVGIAASKKGKKNGHSKKMNRMKSIATIKSGRGDVIEVIGYK